MKKFCLAVALLSTVFASNAEIIKSRPDGEMKYYQRTGGLAYKNDGSQLYLQNQAGFTEIVYSADGTKAWIKNPVVGFATEEEEDAVWIVGDLSGDGTVITVMLGQEIYHDTEQNDFLRLYLLDKDTESSRTNYICNTIEATVKYAIDGDKVSLLGTDEKRILGLVWQSDRAWSGFGDYGTVYSLYDLPDPVTPPANLVIKDYPMSAFEYMNEEDRFYQTTVSAGFDGNDVYIRGIDKFLPSSWIKGKLDATGKKVTFDVQYIGTDPGQRRHFLTGWNIGQGGVAPLEINYYKDIDAFESTAPVIINSNPTMHHYYAYYRSMFIGDRPAPVELPAGLTTMRMVMTGKIDDTGLFYHKFTRTAAVAVDGDKVYFQGLSFDMPEAWVVGTLTDGKVVIPSGQFLGVGELSAVYLHGMNSNMTEWSDIVLAYDEATLTYTTECTLIEASALVPRSYLWRYEPGTKIYYDADAPTGADPDDLTAVKYVFKGKCSSNTSLVTNGAFELTTYVAKDGNIYYVKGFSPELPDAWAKGEMIDNVVTFTCPQLLGTDALTNMLYFSGIDLYQWVLTDFRMQYNPADESFKFLDHAVINRNATSPNYSVWYQPESTLTKDSAGIDDIVVDQETVPAEIYTLQGIRVTGALCPGTVYIIGGKKVLYTE